MNVQFECSFRTIRFGVWSTLLALLLILRGRLHNSLKLIRAAVTDSGVGVPVHRAREIGSGFLPDLVRYITNSLRDSTMASSDARTCSSETGGSGNPTAPPRSTPPANTTEAAATQRDRPLPGRLTAAFGSDYFGRSPQGIGSHHIIVPLEYSIVVDANGVSHYPGIAAAKRGPNQRMWTTDEPRPL